MKPKPITIKLNVSRIDKNHLYQGKNGKYLDLAVFPNATGTDQYGNTHFVIQSLSKEAREKGEKGPIVGNARIPVEQAAPRPATAQTQRAPDANIGDDDVGF